jgi:Domain of unknown function (DUF1990)
MQTALLESRTAGFNFAETLGFPDRLTMFRIKQFDVADIRPVADGIGFFDYRIFPREIMEFCAEWHFENRSMRVGDTIAQCARLPFGLVKGLFAVRIQEIRRQQELCSFSYGTLAGHPEMGISYFQLAREEDSIAFRIATTSRPAWLASCRGLVSLISGYQRYCTSLALQNVAAQLETLRSGRAKQSGPRD